MSKEKQAILDLLVEKNKYKDLVESYEITLQNILSKLYSIGAPLNDNILKFNSKQLKFLSDITLEIKSTL